MIIIAVTNLEKSTEKTTRTNKLSKVAGYKIDQYTKINCISTQ